MTAPRPARPSRRWSGLVAALALVVTTAGVVVHGTTGADAAPVVPPTRLAAVGPVNPLNEFPTWYRDSNGLSVGLCDNVRDSKCGLLLSALKDQTAPEVFPTNYPAESMYMLAQSTIALPSGGTAVLNDGLQAGFGSLTPKHADGTVFARVRIRIDTPGPGHYVVTHPYGQDSFDVTIGGTRAINVTQDVGLAPGDYTKALDGRIDPFLTWDTGFVTSPDGSSYLGDPAVLHKVKGSALGYNYFKIDGPGIGGPGVDTVSTDQFALTGKVATNAGVSPGNPTYTRTDSSGGRIDVFASSQAGQAVQVSGPGIPTTSLRTDPSGHYFGRVAFTGDYPRTVQVTNASDRPRTTVDVPVTDLVRATSAVYDSDAGTLTVSATSSDTAVPPVLSVPGMGSLSGGSGTFTTSGVPPEQITVTSSAGGQDRVRVTVTGSALAADPVVAVAGPPQVVQQGQTVLLDGTGSLNATSCAWSNVSGALPLSGASTCTASFTAPAAGAVMTFRLTVQGPGGPKTDDVTVTVLDVAPPVANAGPPQNALQGSLVTLDGRGSKATSSWSWSQKGGVPVTLAGAGTSTPTFTMPKTDDPVIFQVNVTGPGGTDTASVQVNPVPDVLNVDQAEFRRGKNEWRVTGTATVPDANTVTVWIGQTPGKTQLGQAVVDALGGWSVRLKSAYVPDSSGTISVESSRGGRQYAVPLVVRN